MVHCSELIQVLPRCVSIDVDDLIPEGTTPGWALLPSPSIPVHLFLVCH